MWPTSYTIMIDFPTEYTLSFTFSLSLFCGETSVISPTITFQKLEFNTGDTSNKFSFEPFECSISNCCLDLVYTISETGDLDNPKSYAQEFITQPQIIDGQLVSFVDISVPRAESLWIHASNQVGQNAISQKVRLNIIETFHPNFAPIFLGEFEGSEL